LTGKQSEQSTDRMSIMDQRCLTAIRLFTEEQTLFPKVFVFEGRDILALL